MGCFSCLVSRKKVVKIEDTDRARSASRTSGFVFLKTLPNFGKKLPTFLMGTLSLSLSLSIYIYTFVFFYCCDFDAF